MKIISIFVFFSIILLVSCSQNVRKYGSDDSHAGDSSISADQTSERTLTAKMQILPQVKLGDPIELKFTVYNNSDSARTFCKWHTPFEPLMSKYLDITDKNGVEVQYTGPMAKRIMPPPASSYITLAARDSLMTTVNLLKAYSIVDPSTYSVRYNSSEISGLTVLDTLSFTVSK